MGILTRRSPHAAKLALGAWTAVALTPVGWVLGIVLAFLSGEGEAKGIGSVTLGVLGVLLFVAAPATAVVLAIQAAHAGHRSGRIAIVVSGSLLVATLFAALLLGRVAPAVVAVVAVSVFAGSRSGGKPSPPGSSRVRRQRRSPRAIS